MPVQDGPPGLEPILIILASWGAEEMLGLDLAESRLGAAGDPGTAGPALAPGEDRLRAFEPAALSSPRLAPALRFGVPHFDIGLRPHVRPTLVRMDKFRVRSGVAR